MLRLAALAAFAVLNLLDMATTRTALAGGLAEGNPLPSWLLREAGPWAMYAFKAATSILVVAVVVWIGRQWCGIWYAIHLANLIMAVVVLLNLMQLL